jgi:hypothetical protein
MVMNTIIAGNSAPTSPRPDCGGIFVSGGDNLVGITNGSSGWPLSLQDQFGTTRQHSWGWRESVAEANFA